MPSSNAAVSNPTLRNLPSVDALLRSEIARHIVAAAGETHAAELTRTVIDEIRRDIVGRTGPGETKDELFTLAEARLKGKWQSESVTGIHRVINATGVVIHTNLGRAPLSENAKQALGEAASGYCTLEYDLETGKRGRRGLRAENLLAELTGAESVLIVNNCAAAAFFVLTVFAAGGEVIISRGELVEIGGDFRVPDVLAQSGAVLCEVGTTNRTKLADYEKAINEQTRLILRVHPSNYRIVGFTATPAVAELADLAHRHNLFLYEDIGSGALIDLTGVGLADEPVISHSIAADVDVVTFSGDKLLGGPQAGIIAGRTEVIDRLRKHPLYRALRVDKLAYAALESTLDAHRRGALEEIPVLRMLAASKDEIGERTRKFVKKLSELRSDGDLRIHMVDAVSAIGGGAAPAAELATVLLALTHQRLKASTLEKLLRDAEPPVIARIIDNSVMIDLRTVSESEESELVHILAGIGSEPRA